MEVRRERGLESPRLMEAQDAQRGGSSVEMKAEETNIRRELSVIKDVQRVQTNKIEELTTMVHTMLARKIEISEITQTL